MTAMFDRCFQNSTTGTESGYLVYIAGPISGDLLGNVPPFYEAEDRLRAAGHTTFNPARADGGRTAMEAIEVAILLRARKTWADYMRQGITGLMRCNAISTVGDWWTSRGAYIEHDLCNKLGYAKVCGTTGDLLYETTVRSEKLSESEIVW